MIRPRRDTTESKPVEQPRRPRREPLCMGYDAVRDDWEPVGGYLFNPPISCPYRKINYVGTSIHQAHWTDLAFCVSMCKNRCNKYVNSNTYIIRRK